MIQRARLISGLVLFAFAATHFLNHAVGLAGLEAMETVRGWRLTVTRSLPGSIILGLSLLIHMLLGLAGMARKRTTKMPIWEAGQIALGVAIPFFLFPHILNTRFANLFFGVDDAYVYELLQLWPGHWPDQSMLLLFVWIHSCIGLHFWLRLSPLYRRLQPFALAFAVLVPFASLAGFMVAGQLVQTMASDPAVLSEIREQVRWPEGEALDWLLYLTPQSYYAFYPFLAGVLLFASGRGAISLLASKLPVSYVPTPTVRALPGATLLETSRANGIPHTSICGGRARCSTCRVEILEGLTALPAPETAEFETLQRISAPPSVRLACQVSPKAPVTMRLLVRPDSRRKTSRDEAQGVERTLAVLFLDIRGFTNWSQDKLPYDVVFILNQMFAAAGAAIENNGGWIDKYMGDGLMAVFGREDGTNKGCTQAIATARAIDKAMQELNRDLKDELGQSLNVGIGIHVGPLVLGEIGYEGSAAMTVIGRSVNTAARLEAMTKELGCQLIVSREAFEKSGLKLTLQKPQAVSVRGLDEPLEIIAFKSSSDLPVE